MIPAETEGQIALLNSEQLHLAAGYRAIRAKNAKWFRDLFAHALKANGVSQGQIAEATERETSAVSRMLSGEQAFAADVQIEILIADKLGMVLTGMCQRLGYEPPRRRVEDLAEENRHLRATIARLRTALEET